MKTNFYEIRHICPDSFLEKNTFTYYVITERNLYEEDDGKLNEELIIKLEIDFDPDNKDEIKIEDITGSIISL